MSSKAMTTAAGRGQLMNSSGTEMDFFEHLGELRKRLLIAVGAVLIMSIAGWFLSRSAFFFFSEPFYRAFDGDTLIGTGPAEAFILRLKIAAFLGLLLALPVIFFQAWLFISPGLHDHERKLAAPFLIFTTLLFALGVWFCFSVVLPFALEFFKYQYAQLGEIQATIRVSEYVSLLLRALLGFGIVFEMPVLAYFLGRFGVITSSFLIESSRYAVIVIFLVSAILTPPDILTQFLMAGPLMILYALSIGVVMMVEPSDSKNLEGAEGE